MEFKAELDAKSIQEIVRLQGFSALLNPEIRKALIQGSTLLAQAAQANARRVFTRNSPGGLADSIYPWFASPVQVEVRVGVAHGRRREHGFSGMTDSLGRYYPSDPAKPYLRPAMEQEGPGVERLFAAAVGQALGRVAYG